jgi:hypothetical protein
LSFESWTTSLLVVLRLRRDQTEKEQAHHLQFFPSVYTSSAQQKNSIVALLMNFTAAKTAAFVLTSCEKAVTHIVIPNPI